MKTNELSVKYSVSGERARGCCCCCGCDGNANERMPLGCELAVQKKYIEGVPNEFQPDHDQFIEASHMYKDKVW